MINKKGQISKGVTLLLILFPIVFILAAFLFLTTTTRVVQEARGAVDDVMEFVADVKEVISGVSDGNVNIDPGVMLAPTFGEKVASGRYGEWEDLMMNPLLGKLVVYHPVIGETKTITLSDALILRKKLGLLEKASAAGAVAGVGTAIVGGKKGQVAGVITTLSSSAALGAAKADSIRLKEDIGKISAGTQSSCLYLNYVYYSFIGKSATSEVLFYYNGNYFDSLTASQYHVNVNGKDYALPDSSILNKVFIPNGENGFENVSYYYGACTFGGER